MTAWPAAVRHVLFDVDGVLVEPAYPGGWSQNMTVDLGLDPELLHERFFRPHWPVVVTGRRALRETLAPILAEIAPHLSCAALIDYWFSNDARVNTGLLKAIDQARSGSVSLHLATVQDHERARYLWVEIGLERCFDQLFYSAALGAAKPDAAFFREIETRLNAAPSRLLLIDDRIENVTAARRRGWEAWLWTGETTLAALSSIRSRRTRTL